MNPIICVGDTPNFLRIFDLVDVPQLLFYTYVPTIVISIFLGFYIYKNSKTLEGKLFFAVTLFFTLWILDILVVWIAAYNNVLMFAWQITPVFEVPLFVFIIYFIYVITNKERKDISSKLKFIFLALVALVFLLLPTHLNISFYNTNICEGVPGILWNFIYIFEMISTAWVLNISLKRYRALPKTDIFRKEIVYFGFGTILFMILFISSNIIGQITDIQVISFWDSLGMIFFLCFLVYLIVRYKEFNIKLIATQALVWGLVILIGSEFFFTQNSLSIVLIAITLVVSAGLGLFIVRSVKKEIQQREELAKLNIDLQSLMKQRESLMHLITHKVKGSFTRTKFLFDGMLTGTFGEITPEIRRRAQQGLDFDNGGIQTVDLILNVANMQNGIIKYEMKPIDFKELVEKVISEKKIPVQNKGLKMESDIKPGNYNVRGDAIWLKEAINNLAENSIRYTREGKIMIGLENKDNKILFSVKDTGVGITDEDKKNLFTEGGRGANSIKVNVDSTGYGLYTVKLVVEAHKGRVWGESEGEGKGSQFYIELPVA